MISQLSPAVERTVTAARSRRPANVWVDVGTLYDTTSVCRVLREQIEDAFGADAPAIASLGGQLPGLDPGLVSPGPVVLLIDRADVLFERISLPDQLRWLHSLDHHGQTSLLAVGQRQPRCITQNIGPFHRRFESIHLAPKLMPKLTPLSAEQTYARLA